MLRHDMRERMATMPVPTIGGAADIFPKICNTSVVIQTTLNAKV